MEQHVSKMQVEEIHLRDYINVILRRKKTFLVSLLVVVAGVMTYTVCAPPLYESTATLFVKDDQGTVGKMGELLLNSAVPVDSELEILKSRSNAEKVVATLHLNWKVDRRSDGVGFKLAEFTSRENVPVYRVHLTGGGSYVVRDDDGNTVGTGTDGVLMRGKKVTLLLKDLKGAQGDSFRIKLLSFNKTVEELRKKIKATEVGKKTNVISVTYRDQDPILARDVVNTLVQAYLDQGIAIKAEEATRMVGFIEEQLKGIKADLETAEKNLETYKSVSGVVQLDADAQNILATLTDAEKQKAEVTMQRKQIEFALASLKEARRKETIYSPALLRDNPLVAVMASRLAELEVQKRGLLSESTENHPGVRSVQAQIDEVQKKIQATFETSLKALYKQEENVSKEIGKFDSQLKRLPVAERDLARLTRLSKVNADIYTFLLQKHEEARIAQASTISNIKVVDPSIAPDYPVSPQKMKNLLLALLSGAIVGVVFCFSREYFDDTLSDPEKAKRNLSLPVLALIPYIHKQGNLAMITHHEPKSSASEAFRALRTALQFCSVNELKQVMLVTSALSREGKSTVACNLAITLAQTGARVLIIDCDLRRSALHKIFHSGCGVGLADLLAGDIEPSTVVQDTCVEGLDVLRAGNTPTNPVELLGSESMVQFIGRMRKMYSYIIIDAPPVLAVTDAPVLTAVVDLVLLVLEMGRVPVKVAQRTKELLTLAAPVAGLVISDRQSEASAYAYGRLYQHGYAAGLEKKSTWWRSVVDW